MSAVKKTKKRMGTTMLPVAPALPKFSGKTGGQQQEAFSLESLQQRIADGTLKKAGKALKFDPRKRESKKQSKALRKMDKQDEKRDRKKDKKHGSIPVDKDSAPVYMGEKKEKRKKTKTPANWKTKVTMADVRTAINQHSELYCISNKRGTKLALINRLEAKGKVLKKRFTRKPPG